MNPNKTADLDYRRLLREAKQADAKQHPQAVKIALLSDAATQQFVPVLKALLSENGYGAEFYEAPFDAIELEVINANSGLYAFKPDFVILINSIQALRTRYYEHGMASELERIQRSWDSVATHCKGRLIQCNFPLPYERPFGQFDLKLRNTLYSEAQALNAQIAQAASSRSSVLICDLEAVASAVGRRNWFDDRMWDMSKTFCNLDYLPIAAQAMVDLVLAARGKVVKCVVLDLDNTLWGGVVGDTGPHGVEVAAHGDGEAFYRFQKFLLTLKNRGILLAVCSKNEHANALAPFEQNDEMVLKRDDITVFVANWGNKADNIRTIRDTLDIGFDSLLFIDDNAFERNLVRSFLPDVIVPEMPEDPADYVRAISELNLFETTSFSAEDLARSALYKQEAERRETQTRYTDITEYLKALEMRISVRRFETSQIGRISQLFLRSNQFNLMTNRHSEAECTAMMLDEQGCLPLTASLRDRFGEYGLISIVVARPVGDTLHISDWLMSCRVLGRGVEQYLMNLVISIAKQRHLSKITGQYIATSKNAMVKDFWAQFGFESTDGQNWSLTAAQYQPKTSFMVNEESVAIEIGAVA